LYKTFRHEKNFPTIFDSSKLRWELSSFGHGAKSYTLHVILHSIFNDVSFSKVIYYKRD